MTGALTRCLLTTLLLFIGAVAYAHPLAPALLEIRQLDSTTYQLLWRLSAVQTLGIAPQPVLPDDCQRHSEIQMTREPGTAIASRWQMQCDASSLTGKRVSFSGLDRNPINIVFRLEHSDGRRFQALLDARQPAVTIPPPETTDQIFRRYMDLGVEHLVFGPDHLLFLLALILLVGLKRRLIWVLTAFTLGHSITLSLASLGIVQVNAILMEVGIALSLVIAARSLLGNRSGWFNHYPGSMAAGFGLLHGLGFAGALAEIGLPQLDLVWALLAFNIGIELAQVAIVCGLWLCVMGLNLRTKWHVSHLLPAYLIGSLAMFWVIERAGLL